MGRRRLRPAARSPASRRLVGSALPLWALASVAERAVSEPCLARARPLWTGAVLQTAREIAAMAEPRRAAASAPRLEGGRFLIVEARYYDSIGADLLAGATRAIEAAGAAYDLVSVAGALEIPAGMAIALDAAKAAGRPYDGAVA